MTLKERIENLSPECRAQIVALVVTLLLCVAIGVMVVYTSLTYIPGAAQQWPPADSSELLFEGEYVMTGDVTEPEVTAEKPAEAAAVEEPKVAGHDLTNEAEPAPQPAPPVVSERPSAMKVTPPAKKEERTGPTKAEIEAKQAKEKAERETQQRIAGQMKFGSNTSSGKGSGKSGSADGNSATGKLSGAPGHNLTGRTLAHWELPSKTAPTGSVSVRVVVNQQGQVIDASVASSSGAASSEAVRAACVAAAKRSKFSVKLDAPARQSGTITYKFVSQK